MTNTPPSQRWRLKKGPAFWVMVFVIGFSSIAGLASSGVAGLFAMWGGIGIVSAIYAIVTGRGSWASLPGRKAATGMLAASVVVLIAGGAIAGPGGPAASDTQADGSGTQVRSFVDTSATPSPTPSILEETVDAPIAFSSTTVDDPTVDVGIRQLVTTGAPGVNTRTYKVTYLDGREIKRVLLSETVTLEPVAEVTSIGSKPAAPAPPPAASSECDPNYSGACVPIASDVDCAGGSGNGPAYVRGPVTVIGNDIYQLDRDGDGIACD